MAIMIPETPRTFVSASLEDIMFESLKMLPDSYYVFHSFKITDVNENVLNENETDFVIFNKQKGVLCIEAKAGAVHYEFGEWVYGNGIPMHNGGPFHQAEQNKWKLVNYIRKKSKLKDLLKKCKFLHSVWFPSVFEKDISKINLPSEGNKNIILTRDDLENPIAKIEKIFDIEVYQNIKTILTEEENLILLNEVFCPNFNIFPTSSLETDIKKIVFHRMLKEQINVLDFLEEQKTVAICGVAGTGKTLIALEKAQRLVHENAKVLFLCFNNKLKDFLCSKYKSERIDFFTIAGYACKVCDSTTPDYHLLNKELENSFLYENFAYTDIIIDEGQDLGREDIENSGVLKTLKDIIINLNTGAFYIFYDKLQLVQSYKLPKVITDADCKITLYKNCRNTQNIAKTSLKLFPKQTINLKSNSITGIPANLNFITINLEQKIDELIKNIKNKGINDIVILTCKTEETSGLAVFIKDGVYKGKTQFSTCRKFKGLESDAVILIDIDKKTFSTEEKMLYYVGTSRAKLHLEIITSMTEDDCRDLLIQDFNKLEKKIKHPKRELASVLNCNITD